MLEQAVILAALVGGFVGVLCILGVIADGWEARREARRRNPRTWR